MNKDDYRRDFDRIHGKLETLDSKLDDHLGRISKIETTQKGITTVFIAMITAGLTAIAKFFNLG